MSENYYDILGISKTAGEDEIKKAFRKLAIETHPDKHPGDKEAEEKFKKINEAYSVLSDKEKRAQYDMQMNSGFRSGPNPFQENGFDFGDIFGDFFNNSPFSHFHSDVFNGDDFRNSQNTAKRPENLTIKLNMRISFEESYSGCKKTISYQTNETCSICGGSGYDKTSKFVKCGLCNGAGYISKVENSFFGHSQRVKMTCPECEGRGSHYEKKCDHCHGTGTSETSNTINVNIPAGSYKGMNLRVQGMGRVSKNGKRGDLFLIIDVPLASKDGKFYRDEGFDIKTKLNLTYYDILCGSTKSITLPNGVEKTFKIPENIKVGEVLKIKNCGFKQLAGKLGSQANGDLLITINLKPVGKLTEEQKELLKKFNDTLK